MILSLITNYNLRYHSIKHINPSIENEINNDIEMENLGLLHAKIGADIGRKKFGFDEEMCSAISCHTTGKENMTINLNLKLKEKDDYAKYKVEIENGDSKDYKLQLSNLTGDEYIEYSIDCDGEELVKTNSTKIIHIRRRRDACTGRFGQTEQRSVIVIGARIGEHPHHIPSRGIREDLANVERLALMRLPERNLLSG